MRTSVSAAAAPRQRLNAGLIVVVAFLIGFATFTTVALLVSQKSKPSEPLNVQTAAAETKPTPLATTEPAEPQAAVEAAADTVTAITEENKAKSNRSENETPPAASRNLFVPNNSTKRVVPPDSNQSIIFSPPPSLPASREEPKAASVAVLTTQPETTPGPTDELPARIDKDVSAPVPAQQQSPQPYNSSRLLILGPAVPEPLTILVSVDNELLFRREASMASAGFEDSEGRLQFGAPTLLLSEERLLPPGRHKIQVNMLLGTRRMGRVQEITDRFYPGQRRVLHIEFPLDTQLGSATGRDPNRLFSITLK